MSKRQQRLSKADRAANATAVRDLSTIASNAQMPAVNPNNQTPADMAAWANAFFGPGVPRQPMIENEQPRQFDYPSGINLQIIPRSGFGLIPFWQLRAFADTFEYVRVVIEAFKREIRSLEWDIQAVNPTDDADYTSEIGRLRSFWRFPDGISEFDAWLNSVLEDMLVIDSVSLWLEMDERGDIGGVTQIDGATIRPLLDARGRVPIAPTPAYAQVIKGIDWLWMNTEQFLYRPFNTAVNLPYGTSPTEFIMTTVNTTLRRQMAAMVYWDQTNTPEALVGLPGRWTTEQVTIYQNYFDSLLSGNLSKLRRIKFMPVESASMPVHEFRRPDTGAGATAQDEWALKVCCWAFGLSPSEFGLVNGAGLGGKGFMEGAENALYRFGIGPVIQYLQNLISGIIARQTKEPLCFRFTNIGPSEDRKSEAELMEMELRNGVIDVNVWRQRRGQEPIDNAEPFMVIGNAPVLLRDIFKAPAKPTTTEGEGDMALAGADIQQLAMNGAQVQSLVELVTSVSETKLAPESAIQIILNAFPAIPEVSVRNMVNAAKGIEPPKPPAPIPPQLAQAQTQPAQPEGTTESEPNPDDQVVKLALGAWREKCVKRVKDGKPAECDPPTLAKAHITHAMAERIKAGLREGSIDAAFELVKKKPAQHVTPERDKLEEQFARVLRTALKDASDFLPNIDSADDARAVLSDKDFWNNFRAELGPVLTDFIGKGAAHGITEARTDERFQVGGAAAKMAKAETKASPKPPAVTVDWDLVNDQAQDWARAHSGELLTDLEANTKAAMGELIADWIERGEPTSVLSTQFIVLVNDPKRAELIAVTEITRAFAQGNTEAWKAQGVEGRKWFTSEDELVCPICGDLAGSVARLGDDFEGGVDNPPAHPRCRCWVQPVEVVE